MDLLAYIDGFITCAEEALQEYAHWEGYGVSIIQKMISAKEAVLLDKSEDADFVWLCPSSLGDIDMKYKQMYYQKVLSIVRSHDAFDKDWAMKLCNYTHTNW
jgi:hypothetical protein